MPQNKVVLTVETLRLPKEATLLQAMQRMDEVGSKSLLLLEDEKLIGLLSIGDIQRAIIANKPLDTTALSVARTGDNIVLAHTDESSEVIKSRMLEHRTAYMPVVDIAGRLHRIILWEDLFQSDVRAAAPLPAGIQVVIMAGGFGSRLRPLTHVIPKPLIPIGEETILETIIGRFTELGAKEFYLTVNYKSEMIRFYMDGLPNRGYNVEYLLESAPLGTAGSLSMLRGRIKDTFFVTNCDIVIEDEYAQMYDYHKQSGNDITMVASVKNLRIPYGTVESGENGELIALKEKPEMVFMINTGMYILEPGVLDGIEDDTFLHITDLMEQVKAGGGRVGVFPISEKSWFDIGEWPEYQKIINKYIN